MNQPPLNPDALRRAADAVSELYADGHCPKAEDAAEVAVSAYLAAALPEVASAESIPAKINLISWDGQHELDADLAPDETLVVLTVKTDRSWSLGDKAELTIHRPEVKP